MEKLHVFNTLTRSKERFVPLQEGFVGMYVCGPTVYGDAHLGHAKSYVSFDIIVRYLRYLGFKVRYVQNITDVGHLTDDADDGEDKLQKQSIAERKEPMEIAEHYTYTYFRDMDALNVLRPDISPRATGHIPEQIAMIEQLLEKGHAYPADGNVYFDVTSDPDYGKLSGRKLDEAESGTRVNTAGDKRNPADFALWKKADSSHLMQWPSPWGPGYPGWHIECSAMSSKYLGRTFDIHGGGLENQFPHHECEIAQSECAHGQDFVKYWLHNNMVTLNGQKMGKSLGNAISLQQFFTGNHPLLTRSWSPAVIRFFLLQSHYRSTTDFSEQALEAAESGLKNLTSILDTLMKSPDTGKGAHFDTHALQAELEAQMNDDFNTARALAVLFDRLKPLRTAVTSGQIPVNMAEVKDLLSRFTVDVLGLQQTENIPADGTEKLDAALQLIIELRAQARKERDWPTADLIRDRLAAAGIRIEDGPAGSTYKID
ncbi:MAG: cysteinyl-tRNA synthetase CysS [Bacteroidetes bacterium HLUCCA01]|nr:MAG: cysteinyl-tRNA synthetase CysS [Bacteroidetes bacterium HLUCCA01]